MKLGEDRAEIAKLLGELLSKTSCYRDVVSCEFVTGERAYPYGESVIVKFENGIEKVVNVNMDSGYSLIKDVMRWLDEDL